MKHATCSKIPPGKKTAAESWNKPVVDVFCPAEVAPVFCVGVKATITATAARAFSASQPHPTLPGFGERKTKIFMKLSKGFQGVLIGSAFLLATDAFAANKGTLHVNSPEIVAGERLAAGDYTVRWDGTGPSVQFRIMQGSKMVVAATARIVALETASPGDSVVVEIYKNGVRQVSLMSFSGQKTALQIEESSESAIAQGNN